MVRTLFAFWLGYQIADLATDGWGDWATRCESCGYIREGLQTCSNVPVENNQTLPLTGADVELDQECFCTELNYDTYDSCFTCESRFPQRIRDNGYQLRDSCDTFLQSYITTDDFGSVSSGKAGVQISFLVSAAMLLFAAVYML